MRVLIDKINGFVNSITYSVFLTLQIVVLGISGGKFVDSVPTSWPWLGFETESYSDSVLFKGYVLEYYILLIVFIFMFYLRENQKIKAHNNLLNTIRTMPPAKIMTIFEKSYSRLKRYVNEKIYNENTDVNETIGYVDDAIRLGLDVMTAIAANFQRADSVRYAANIMLYKNITDMDEGEEKNVLKLMEEYLNPITVDGLVGALILVPEYSASTDDPNDSFQPDKFLTEFALPIPEKEYSSLGNKKYFLPGAPEALIKGRSTVVNDTHKLYLEYSELKKYDIAPGIFEGIDNYFKNIESGQKIRSFMSMPIKYLSSWSNGLEVTLGVINIHSDEKGLFASKELENSYTCLCQPVVDIIADLITMRTDLQSLVENGSQL